MDDVQLWEGESLVAIRSDGLSVEKVTWQPALGRT